MAECQTCRGSRYIWREDKFSAGLVPCPQCNGHAIESCCDGEDRWQPDKMDKPKKPEDKPR